MGNRVQLITGMLSGVISPFLMFIVFGLLSNNLWLIDKPHLGFFVSVALNLFLLRYFIRNEKQAAATGVSVVTFLLTVAVFALKLKL